MLKFYHLEINNFWHLISRLGLAVLIGAIIGIEREFRQKPAGLRTHMLVSLGSALFIIIPLQITTFQDNPDALSRVIQGIATGVGFLGAGEIVRESSRRSPTVESNSSPRLEVHGLTSAAAIWVSAGLGITAGCGLWQLGLVGAVLTFAILNLFKRLER